MKAVSEVHFFNVFLDLKTTAGTIVRATANVTKTRGEDHKRPLLPRLVSSIAIYSTIRNTWKHRFNGIIK